MIGSIVSASMRLRSLVVIVALALLGVGIIKLDDMPVDVLPEILPTTVHVHTEALGLSAVEVEQLITVPIEADLLAGTPWVEVMRSESVPGLSSIELTFKRGTDPMHARQVVQERLTQAHALPNVSKPPVMLKPLSSTNRIMLIGLTSKTQSLIEMSVLARWTIRPRLMGVPGVANVSIWGQRERQLQVLVDPARLRARNISVLDIVKTTGNSLWYSPLTFLEASVAGTGGFIETPNQRLGVRHVLPISVAADLAKVPVEGTSTPLHEVATVVEDHQPLIGDAMNSGGPGLLLVVEKLPGVNTLEVSEAIVEAMTALKPGLGGMEFDPTIYSPAGYIRTAIDNVERALLIGLGLVVLLLLALSHNWRAALIGMFTIPVSIMVAALIVHQSGATINVMMVAGLMVALGIVVDDAILYAFIVMRRMRGGATETIAQTLLGALAEVRRPMVFATAIVLLAAVPALFMAGTHQALFHPLVKTYTIAVLTSLAAAMTLTPALAFLLLQRSHGVRRESAFSGFVRKLSEGISPAVAGLATAVVVITGLLGLLLLPRLDLPALPSFKEPDLLIDWDADPGTSRSAMNRMIDRASKEIRSVPGVRSVGAHVGRAIMSDQVVGINSSEMWVNLSPDADYDKTVAAIEEIVGGYPGIDGDVTTFLRSRFSEELSPVEEPIVVRLYGQREDVLEKEADKLLQTLTAVNGLVNPHIEVIPSEPVVEIEVDLAAAKAHGVKPGDVRRAAATLLAGIEVGNLFEQQKIFEVVVWGMPHLRHSIAGISELQIDKPSGGHVRLGDIARVELVSAPNVIRRENVARSLDIVAGVNGRSVSAVAADVRSRIDDTSFPLEYRAEIVGDFASQEAATTRMTIAAIGVAIGIIFVLQAAFGGWGLALAVAVTLPFALGGGLLVATAADSVTSLPAMAGLLTVFAIAVRHTILLVARYRTLRSEQGMSMGPELVAAGVRDRAAPIWMTTIVTAAAVLPFAILGNRPGLEVLGPLAMVILGGLATATLYSLCVLPALYARFGAGATPDVVEEEDLSVTI